MRTIAPLGMLLATLLACASAQAQSWQAVANEALLKALRTQFPAVEDWQTAPLISRRQQDLLERAQVLAVGVTRTGKRSAVRLSAKIDEHSLRTTLWFAVTALQRVPVAARDLTAGEILGEPALRRQITDVFDAECTSVVEITRAVGMRLKSAVAEGRRLCEEQLQVPPLVGKGQRVSVRSTAGLVTIETSGIAQQDGDLGKVLRVKNASNGETFLAAVTGRAEVTVHE